jgi:hypothetical protein
LQRERQDCSAHFVVSAFLCLFALGSLAACGSSSASSPGGGGNPTPAISSLSPSSVGAGSAGFTLTVTGTGFISSSAVEWNGSARTTNFVSSTQLQAQINALDIVSGGSATITVTSPPPGGGTSAGARLTINSNAGLSIASLSPSTALAGGQLSTLTVNGTGFVSNSVVQWNGIARPTTFVSSSEVQAQLYGDDTADAGSIAVTVMNPSGITSPPATFSVTDPLPTITSIGPGMAQAGSGGFVMNVVGTNFVPSSTVEWNGMPLATTYYGGIQLMAAVTTSDLAAAGSVAVTVANPAPGGGTSAPATFTIIASGGYYTLTTLDQASNDLVWDPVNQVIYLSVPSTAKANGNTISILNPATGSIVASQFVGSEPDVLALSTNSQYLYSGLDGSSSVQRFTLPNLGTDINYSLGSNTSCGPYYALDLQAAPIDVHTTAVTLGCFGVSPAAQGGILVYDDAIPRPTKEYEYYYTFDTLQWGSDDTSLYSSDNTDSGFDFYTLSVNSGGVALDHDYVGDFPGYNTRLHYDAGTQLVYGDDGDVVVPSTGMRAGVFEASGLMVPDSTLNAAFFLGQTESQIGGTTDYTIESFNLTQFTPVAEITVPSVIGKPLRFIRWGQDGLALNTDGGEIYILSGTFVGAVPNSQKRDARPVLPRVQRTWKTSRTIPALE